MNIRIDNFFLMWNNQMYFDFVVELIQVVTTKNIGEHQCKRNFWLNNKIKRRSSLKYNFIIGFRVDKVEMIYFSYIYIYNYNIQIKRAVPTVYASERIPRKSTQKYTASESSGYSIDFSFDSSIVYRIATMTVTPNLDVI